MITFNKRVYVPVLIYLMAQFLFSKPLWATDYKIGVGFKAGINKLEGDWKTPRFNPMGAFVLSYAPVPYFTLATEVGYSNLLTKDAKYINPSYVVSDAYYTSSLPIGLDLKFNFFPRASVNPFTSLGIGGLSWKAMYNDSTISKNGSEQKGFGFFFKTSGGLEFNFNDQLSLVAGADFSYVVGNDSLDQIDTGDLDDGITSMWIGLNYYFGTRDPQDLDNDNIPNALDLDLNRPEDRDGFWDHDGKPEVDTPANLAKGPVLIHYPIFRAEEGVDLKIKAVITSNIPLRTAAILYRTAEVGKWNMAPLKNTADTFYEGVIKGRYINTAGLEYCVIAVDNNLKGIGYSGVPKRPIRVKVDKSGHNWRIASGIIAFIGWGTATYIVMRRQHK